MDKDTTIKVYVSVTIEFDRWTSLERRGEAEVIMLVTPDLIDVVANAPIIERLAHKAYADFIEKNPDEQE